MPEPETVTIRRLGARGDGLTADGLAVAYALPGERVSILREGQRGDLLAVEEASPDRIAPFCPYFTRCGGCAVQHLAPEPYAAWKQGLLAQALSQAGLPVTSGPVRDARGAGRRRITLHVRAVEGRAEAGLMEARSHALVAIDHCPITVPALHQAPAIARALSAPLGHGRKPLDVAVTASEAGLDVDLRGHGPVGEGVRAALVRLAGELDLVRLALHGDVVVERRPVQIPSGEGHLLPPPGGFLQATAAGEAALTELVLTAFDRRVKRVADLFAGCGPFTLALARAHEVHAVEGDDASLAGLDRAVRGRPGLRRVTTERRDLFRRPLLAHDLNAFDAVVFDPPRAGAQAQARQLAESKVPLVVGVACDTGTFARDAATLIAGGYRLERVTPVDQFAYSAHVEVVGVFRREPVRKRR
ncbi:class I SAM-dependent RNA methyltransferase [Methylobacterium planeticum]|uniref:Class I SAM-dependent RNA methyltransferase n=1 Tax=Methylobacterium planeticum TaxID=2615211 RepID=A0A6N6MXJ5_9HYPH|nr:class I SAM-dependent RNA methyltransferase [Methylobacterium planeticum]KAB1074750.1 class I SAM-dependent RNA methyltransferase [Methylobacterium planeticum]